MRLKLKKIIFILISMILALNYSCKTKAPLVIKETEYVSNFNYCNLDDFMFDADDILNSNHLSLNSIIIPSQDSSQFNFEYHQNINYSPENKYFVEFKFINNVPSLHDGICYAYVYDEYKILITIVKDIHPYEKVIWFNNYLIFNGYGPKFSRKIIVDLITTQIQEIQEIGKFDFIGKYINSAYYINLDAGATLGKIRAKERYSIYKISKNEISLVENKLPSNNIYYYNEYNSVLYNTVTDSFDIYQAERKINTLKSKSSLIVFDEFNSSTDSKILINNKYFYKISENLELLMYYKTFLNDIGKIIEFKVCDNRIIFKSARILTDRDFSDNGNYVTKNKLQFNLKDTRFSLRDVSHGVPVIEFGILDVETNKLEFPSISILN